MASVKNYIKSVGGGSTITVVANYSSLPDVTTVTGNFYWCSASQGMAWLPGSLGGTYYNSGMYYSNGTTWEFVKTPYQATQAEVDTGTNTDKFVTPSTFTNASKWGTKQDSLTEINFGAFVNSITSKTTPIDADSTNLVDSADSNKAKKVTFLNFWTNYIKVKADALYYTINQSGLSVYAGTITWTGTTAPSGATSHTYNWTKIGNIVTLNINLFYATIGSANTAVVMTLPSGSPTPLKPTGLTNASEKLYQGTGKITQNTTSALTGNNETVLRSNSTNNGFEIWASQTSVNAKIVQTTVTYYTA